MSNLEELPLNEYRDYIKVQTDKGTEVATNLVIPCIGIKINSSAYRSAFGKEVAQLWPACAGHLFLSSTPWKCPESSPPKSAPAFFFHHSNCFSPK